MALEPATVVTSADSTRKPKTVVLRLDQALRGPNLTRTLCPIRLGLARWAKIFQVRSGLSMPELLVRKGKPVDGQFKRWKNKLDAEGFREEVRRMCASE